MPKPDVDEVTLVALQELPPHLTPDGTWKGAFGPTQLPDPADNLLAYGLSLDQIGDVIAAQIGSGINRPDRVYHVGGAMPVGSSIELDVGGNPTILVDPYLNELDYSVHLRGVEYLEKGAEWQNDIPGGGFRYTDGRIFENEQMITVSFKPQISSVISTPDAVARFFDASGIYLVSATTVLGVSAQRRLVFIQGATAVVSITLDDEYPEGVLCGLLTASGIQKQTTILAPVGQDIVQNGIVASFVLGESEWAYLVRFGTRWYVHSISPDWKQVGLLVMGGIPGPNLISANGQTLQIAEYPRVDRFLTRLEAALPGSVVSIAAWATNKTKWARGATEIIVPQKGGWFPRFLDLGAGKDTDRGSAGNIVGSTQINQNKAHVHDNGDYKHLLKRDTHGTVTGFDDDPSNEQPNLLNAFQMLPDGGIEARPENVGEPALYHI